MICFGITRWHIERQVAPAEAPPAAAAAAAAAVGSCARCSLSVRHSQDQSVPCWQVQGGSGGLPGQQSPWTSGSAQLAGPRTAVKLAAGPEPFARSCLPANMPPIRLQPVPSTRSSLFSSSSGCHGQDCQHTLDECSASPMMFRQNLRCLE